MAFLTLDREKLRKNYEFLNATFLEHDIQWAVVSKLLCGTELYLRELIDLGVREVCDSRITNLKTIKQINPEIETVYIKPPAMRSITNVVKYADASFNTEYSTIKWLSEEAQRQNKTHKVIIMIELGDLREGIMGEHLVEFYDKIFQLPNIKVTGLGSNLNCLYGVMPSEDKLVQLSLYEQLLEAKFNQRIPWVTGGTSVVLPLLFRKQVPKGVNHFRIGETLFFGNNLITGETIEGMESDVFKLYAEIIEITEKPVVPIGAMEVNPSGKMYEINEEDYGRKSYRALIDVGVLDIASEDFIDPDDKALKIVGGSSDMIVLDLGDRHERYKVGDLITFNLRYMGALRLLNSAYIEKKIV